MNLGDLMVPYFLVTTSTLFVLYLAVAMLMLVPLSAIYESGISRWLLCFVGVFVALAVEKIIYLLAWMFDTYNWLPVFSLGVTLELLALAGVAWHSYRREF